MHRHNLFVSIFVALAIILLLTPLQHYITIARNQHYGLAIAAVSLGYLLQGIVSWPQLNRLGRVCHIATGLFFAAASITFMQNSWLDYKTGIMTEQQAVTRQTITALYIVFGLILSILWLRLVYENMTTKNKM